MDEERIINAIRKIVANDEDKDYYGISGAEIHDWLESKSSNEHSALQFAIACLIDKGYNRTAKCLEKYFNYAPSPDDAERKQLYSDGYYSSRSNLALDFMHYLDEHRPEEKMCLSNGECAQLQEAFKNGDVETIVRYINKYQQPAQVADASKMERLNVDDLHEWSMRFAPGFREMIEATAYHFWDLAIYSRKEK